MMPLDGDQEKSANAWFRRKWLYSLEGPMCQNKEWEVPNRVFVLKELRHGTLEGTGAEIPVIVVTCANCGYTIQFNAIQAGVVDPGSIVSASRGW